MGTLPDFLKDIPGVEFRTDWVHVSKWQEKLAELNFDIGLVPVVQRPFNEGKSNIKWQEYSMLEIPTIASRVGEYKEIEHGVTGYLANSEAEWYHNLTKLADDAQLRKTIGKQAKQYTLEHHNISKRIYDWDTAYRTIIDKFHA
jgi:glycosyltransferase involved in cell wall biosynthesis